ncbi:hypothetical protein PG996_012822 [Apiospora saccharicola]|uniref:Uncharacterized protein n=1 Tax=Apiospora saccharicola TaxID=335842 RepID=A0ABR1U3Q5_9PEZI
MQLRPLPCNARPTPAETLALLDTRGVEAEVDGQLLDEFVEFGVQSHNLVVEVQWEFDLHLRRVVYVGALEGAARECGQPERFDASSVSRASGQGPGSSTRKAIQISANTNE